MRGFWLAVAVMVSGCAGMLRGADDPRALFADDAFAPPAHPVDAKTLFALDDGMRAFFDGVIAPKARQLGPERGLFEAMRDSLSIDYDATMTRTAAETFAARSGNCLSLVILTGAFAHRLGLPVKYQSVHGDELWSRAGGIAFLNGHVNVVLGDGVVDRMGSHALVIDFLPSGAAAARNTREIEERTVVAMYLNNRAAETLAAGDVEAAYWLARAAAARDPLFVAAYNTLGVVYLRHGNLPEAERALRYADGREPSNPQVLTNLAQVLSREGKAADADLVRRELASIEPYPPYYFLDAGVAALNRGDTIGALVLFRKELRRMPYDDEVHFAIAVASLRLGEMDGARRHLELALENSAAQGRHDVYAAKLEYIKTLQRSSN